MQIQKQPRCSGWLRNVLAGVIAVAVSLGTASSQAAITQDLGSNHIAWAATNDVTIVNGSPTVWWVTNDATSSGGLVLYEQGTSDTVNTASTAEWSLVFKTAGTYQLYIRYRVNPCCGGNSYNFPDAFGATPNYKVSKANENGTGPTSYIVLKEQEQNAGALATFTVAQADVDAATPLTFKIGTREAPGLSIDRIILSTDITLDANNGAGFNALANSGAGFSITTQPNDIAADTGNNVVFSGSVAGGLEPYTYLWYTNGVADPSGNNASYTFTNVLASHNGRTFQLVVTDANNNSITSRVATLTVNPLHFADANQPSDQTVPIAQPATFTASSILSGTAPYTYQWYTNSVLDPSATASSYTLNNADASANGRTFQVVVTDANTTSVTSRVATLTVLSAPGWLAVSFTGRGDCAPGCSTLVNSTVAGVMPQGYWNNIDNSADANFAGVSATMNDGVGVPTPVTLTYAANDAWNNDGPSATGNDKMMKGISKANGANRLNTYTFNKLSAQAYDLICYINVNGDNRIGDFTANNTTYYVTLQHQFGGTFIQAQNQNPAGTRDLGNYIRYNNVVPNASGQIAMTMVNRGDPDGTGIAGFQLIPKGQILAFAIQPADALNRWQGSKVMFTSTATFGSGPYTYLWYTNGVADTSLAGAQPNYVKTVALSDNNTLYQVVATDTASLSITSRVARLTVTAADPSRNISLNFAGRNGNGGGVYMNVTNLAGVVPLTNWNNNQASGEMAGAPGDSGALINDLGGATPVTVHWECNDSWHSDGSATGADANYIMMYGFAKDQNGYTGSFRFDNLPPESAYDVYMYANVNGGGSAAVRYNAWVLTQGDPASGVATRTNYVTQSGSYPGSHTQAENSNPAGPYPNGTYVKFTNVFTTASGQLFIGHKHVSGSDGAGYPGIQLIRRTDVVATPPALVSDTLTQSPAPVFEGSPVTLSGLTFTGVGPRFYQWQTNTANDLSGIWVDITGANSSALVISPLVADNGRQFRVIGGNSSGSLTSSPIALQVVQDVTAPTLVRALGGANKASITLTFSEPMRVQDATNPASYFVTNSAGAALTVNGGTVLSDGKTVILSTAPQTSGDNYTIVITGLRDRALSPNTISPNPTIASFTASDLDYVGGQVLFRAYNTGPGGGIGDLTNSPLFPNSPDFTTNVTSLNSRAAGGIYANNSREHYGGTIVGQFIPPASGNWILYISSDDDGQLLMNTNGPSASGATVVRFAPGCCRALVNGADPTPPVSLIAGQAYYIEARFEEGTGGDYVEVGARLQGDTAPITITPASQLAYMSKMVVTQALADITVEEFHQGLFSVGVSVGGAGGVTYQWARATDISGTVFTNIPGATASTYMVGPVHAASDDNFQYQVVIRNPITSITNTATLHVAQDLEAPRLLSATIDPELRHVTLTFSEAMNTNDDAFLGDALSYFFSTNGNPVALDFSATNTSLSNVVLTFVPGQFSEDTLYQVDVCCVSDASTNAIDASFSTATFRTPLFSRGFARYDFYFNIGGGNISDLLASPAYPKSPSLTYITNNLDFPQTQPTPNGIDNYGLRMSGYFVPPTTGDYIFTIKNDDGGRFSLSTDDTAANLVNVIDVACCNGGFSNPHTVNKLSAGQRYYFEALVKEAGGGDYLSIGVQPPGSSAPTPISAQYLAIAIGSSNAVIGGISQQPQDVTVEENHPATFTVGVTNQPGYTPFIQWQTSAGGPFTDFPGAVGATVTSPPIPLSYNGLQVRAAVYLPGNTFYSAVVTLHVNADTNKPVALSTATANGTQVGVRLTEALDNVTATDTNNYSINGERPLSAALRPGGSNVVLIVATPIATNAEFTLVLSNLTDIAASPNVVDTTTLTGKYWIDTVVDIGPPNPAGTHFSGRAGDIEITSGGNDVWGNNDQFTFAYTPRTNDFDVKVRVDSILYVGSDWSKAGINARSSTANNAAMVWFYPTPAEGASHTYEGTIRHTDGANNLEDFQPRPSVVFPSWLRLIRSGSLFTPYISADGTNWNVFGTNAPYAAPELPATLLVGVGAVSHVDGTATTAKFAEFGDTHPTINVQHIGDNLVIRWDGAGVLLYADDLPAASWTPIPAATSGYTVLTDQAHRYYKVQRLFPMQ